MRQDPRLVLDQEHRLLFSLRRFEGGLHDEEVAGCSCWHIYNKV